MSETRKKHRLQAVQIDEASLAPMTRDVEHERQVAIFDLLEENYFQPVDAETGPYDLVISLIDGRLALDIAGPGYAKRHLLSLSPFRGVIKDYFMICESYYQGDPPSHALADRSARYGAAWPAQ